jgi:hypothetical protein
VVKRNIHKIVLIPKDVTRTVLLSVKKIKCVIIILQLRGGDFFLVGGRGVDLWVCMQSSLGGAVSGIDINYYGAVYIVNLQPCRTATSLWNSNR